MQLQKSRDLENWLGVRQSHWKYHHSVQRILYSMAERTETLSWLTMWFAFILLASTLKELRLQEHRTEVESKTRHTFTRSNRASILTEHNKSALTDHATQENHVINWSQAMVIDREPEHFTRWIKEAVHIQKEGQLATNRDEGSYQLSHIYDRFLDTASSPRVKNRKNRVPASSDESLWQRSKRQVLGNNFGCVWWI